MKVQRWGVVCLGLLLALPSATTAFGQDLASAMRQARRQASNQQGNKNWPRDADEAWKWMQDSMKKAGLSQMQFDKESMKVTAVNNSNKSAFSIDLSAVTSIQYNQTSAPLATFYTVQWYEFPYLAGGPNSTPGHIEWTAVWTTGPWHASQHFYYALRYLASYAEGAVTAKTDAALEDFRPKAGAWSKLAVKPPMPKEAHDHQVLAVYAYKQKDLPKAINEYYQALNIDPYWPSGHYDLAMITSEIGGWKGYFMAIWNMQEYLMLVPDAPDAQAIQDNIVIWKDKLTQAQVR